jgi:flagellar secretion chaperone FliS
MSDVARSTYQQIEIHSASGLQLVVMLYDGAIRFLGDAKACIQKRDLAGKAVAVDRSLAVLGELQSTLKLEEGGELAQSLDRLYTYITARILDASLRLTVAPLDEAIKLLGILNSGWTEIARVADDPQGTQPAHLIDSRVSANPQPAGPLEIFG